MPPDDILTDDYVAEMLAKEAADCSLKYSAMGLDAYNKPLKRPANQPKPNTRFLNNIIRDTNSHNRALLAREAADSKARLRELEREEEKKRHAERERLRRLRPGPSDTRKRMLGDIAAIIGGPSKKRKTADDSKRGDRPRTRDERRSSRLTGEESDESSTAGEREAHQHARHSRHRNARKELFADDDEKHAHSHRRHSDRKGSRSRECRHQGVMPDSPKHTDRDSPQNHHGHGHGQSSRTDPDRISHKRGSTTDLFDRRKKRNATENLRLERSKSSPPEGEISDPDPLDDIVGPSLPKPPSPVRPRGRGSTKASSGIDSRFEAKYNPKMDVSVDEDDEWGTALEALRDRQRWKEQGADRLRAAGFTEDQITKWEKGGQKSEEDVHWTKKGEEREWDRGKSLTKFRNETTD